MTNIYVATTGNDTTGNGTAGAPYASWRKGADMLASPGDNLLILPGTYVASGAGASGYYGMSVGYYQQGAAGSPITIRGYGGVPVLDCSNLTHVDAHPPIGVYVGGSYFTFEDIRVINVPQPNVNDFSSGILIQDGGSGASDVTMRRVESDHHKGPGFYLIGAGCHRALFEYCDSHHNYDSNSTNVGDNADGFGCVGYGSTGIQFIRCRAWWNSDDGFDLYSSGQPVIIKDCWAFWNGYQPNTFTSTAGGDGEGFKLGFTGIPGASHVITNNLAVANCRSGLSDNGGNQGVPGMFWYNNTAINNGFYEFLTGWTDSSQTLRNNLALGSVAIGWNGNTSTIEPGYDDDQYNSWNTPPGITITSADFQSVDPTGMDGARRSGGRLPLVKTGRLTTTSQAIDKGTPVGLPYMRSAPDLGAFEMTTIEDHLQAIDVRLGGRTTPYPATFASNRVSLDLNYGPDFTVTINANWNAASPIVATNAPAGHKMVGLVATLSGTNTYNLSSLPWLGPSPVSGLSFTAGKIISLVLVFENGTLVEAQAANRA